MREAQRGGNVNGLQLVRSGKAPGQFHHLGIWVLLELTRGDGAKLLSELDCTHVVKCVRSFELHCKG